MPQSEPHNTTGPFAQLMAEIRACKERRTCRALRVRSFYFEPNPVTVGDWRAGTDEFKAYAGPIDRRVVFVCESPGKQVKVFNNSDPRRCWAVTSPRR